MEETNASTLLHDYSSMVYRIAYSYTKNEFDSNDIMQEVFLRYFKKERAFENSEHQKAWLIKASINCSKTLLSSSTQKNKISLDKIVEPSVEYKQSSDENILSAVNTLPKNQRLCIYLFYFEEYSIREISNILSFKESTVKSHLFRAKASLKELLKGEYGNDI